MAQHREPGDKKDEMAGVQNVPSDLGVDTNPIHIIGEPSVGRFDPNTPEAQNDIPMWKFIQERTINFEAYFDLMNELLRCEQKYSPESEAGNLPEVPVKKRHGVIKKSTEKLYKGGPGFDKHHLPFTSSEAYSLLKFATE